VPCVFPYGIVHFVLFVYGACFFVCVYVMFIEPGNRFKIIRLEVINVNVKTYIVCVCVCLHCVYMCLYCLQTSLLSIGLLGKRVVVQYVDMGNTKTVPASDLRKIKDEFFSVPAMVCLPPTSLLSQPSLMHTHLYIQIIYMTNTLVYSSCMCPYVCVCVCVCAGHPVQSG